MKRIIAMLLTLALLLMLAACGQSAAEESQPQQGTNVPEKTVQEDTTADELYIEEIVEDGIKMTAYRKGGKDGVIVKEVWDYPDGAHYEGTYDDEGRQLSMEGTEADGTRMEMSFYPSGNMEKNKFTYPDGSWDETHYADNGYVDAETGYLMSGTVTYQAHGTADGQVEELISDVEVQEDGTWWETQELGDGSTTKTHYAEGWRIIEVIMDDPVNGITQVIEYYENGNQKRMDMKNTITNESRIHEYYEDGTWKYNCIVSADGLKREEKVSELGYTTYLYSEYLQGVDEYFADDNGNLMKYIENGKVYEGDAIPSFAREAFDQIKTKPAPAVEDSVTVQEADGSQRTTTTYADGTVEEERVSAEGTRLSWKTVYANGETYYQEYYENGTPKVERHTYSDATIEFHYDEEGYTTYYHQINSTTEIEIFTDETGKVVKALTNGRETEHQEWMDSLNFRSW